MLTGKEFRIELIETDVTLVLARRKKKVNRKLNVLLKCTMWKERPKSKALGDIQVCFFVILKKQEIDFSFNIIYIFIRKEKLGAFVLPSFFGCVRFIYFDKSFQLSFHNGVNELFWSNWSLKITILY